MAPHYDRQSTVFVVDLSAMQLIQRPALKLCRIPALPITSCNALEDLNDKPQFFRTRSTDAAALPSSQPLMSKTHCNYTCFVLYSSVCSHLTLHMIIIGLQKNFIPRPQFITVSL